MLRPFFCFYGGKWRLAPRYPSPVHGQIVEPFAGAAGYSVRHPSAAVVLCDLDPVLVGVWRYLIRSSTAEILALPDLVSGQTVDDLPIPQEARWLVGFWLNKGVASPCKVPSAWMRSGRYPGSFWGARVRERIAQQVGAIRHWRVFCCSFDACPVTGAATWFIDPPYQHAGKHYRHGSVGIDFAALSAWTRNRRGQVIACENQGATWLPFQHLASTKTTRRGRRSAEVVWTGGET